MTKSPPPTLEALRTRLEEQAAETAALRATLEVQLTRIAQMQAQLDRVAPLRRKRDLVAIQRLHPVSRNGNGHSDN
jgi:hypothetical protein